MVVYLINFKIIMHATCTFTCIILYLHNSCSLIIINFILAFFSTCSLILLHILNVGAQKKVYIVLNFILLVSTQSYYHSQ